MCLFFSTFCTYLLIITGNDNSWRGAHICRISSFLSESLYYIIYFYIRCLSPSASCLAVSAFDRASLRRCPVVCVIFAVIALFLTHSTTPKRQNDIYILYHMIFVCWSITVSSIAHVCMHASIIRRSFSVLFLTSICVYVSVCVYALRALHVHRMRNHFSFKSSPSSSPPSKRTERM